MFSSPLSLSPFKVHFPLTINKLIISLVFEEEEEEKPQNPTHEKKQRPLLLLLDAIVLELIVKKEHSLKIQGLT